MVNLIESLPPGARVLDLGARSGSFQTTRTDLSIVRLDLEIPASRKSGAYVSADAARMPFASGVFDAIISNHSLEHFCELDATVSEIGRVIRRDGVLYVAVPDATTITDRIYRWLGKGGGHVNAFRTPEDVTRLIEAKTHLPLRSTTLLYSSLSFLNSHNFLTRPPRKIALFAFGNERFLACFLHILRRIDGVLKTRLSVYGWCFYFGNIDLDPVGDAWMNVCVRCGSGSPVEYLRAAGVLKRFTYRCPSCGGFNMFYS